MSEQQDYALTDLKRRPFRTTVVLLSITVIVAFTVFLFLFANVMLDITYLYTSAGIMRSLSVFFEAFIWATLLLVIVLGAVVMSSIASLEVVSRRKDIGLMKAIGTLEDAIFDHFMAQSVILLLGGLVLGVALGTIFYLIGMIWLASVLPHLQFTLEYPLLQIGIVVLLFFFVGYFTAQKPIYDAVHESPVETMNPDVGLKVRRTGYLDTFGMPFRIGTKAAGRRFRGSRRILVSLFLSISLASMLWIGGGVIETTMDSYLMRSMGTNVVSVGHPDVLHEYYEAYSLNSEMLNESVDFIDAEKMIPHDLVLELQGIFGVSTVEQRLVQVSTVTEGYANIVNPITGEYERIGQGRSSTALIMGIDWSETISDWYFEGEYPKETNEVWIGGLMASDIYEDPLIQSLAVRGAAFEIKAIAFEIANGGMTAIMHLSRMKQLLGVDSPNLLLVQLYGYTEQAIADIQQAAENYGLSIFLQEEVLQENLNIIAGLWFLLSPLPLMAMVSAFLSLTNYLFISVFGRFRDYVIMKSIGAKPSFIAKTMIAEGINIGMQAGIPAVLAATLFSVYLLIPEAAVPSILYLPFSISFVLITIVVVVSLAALPVFVIFSSKPDLRISEFSV